MSKKSALVFGNNEYSLEIAKNISYKYEDLCLFALDTDNLKQKSDFEVKKFDLSDEWDDLKDSYDMSNSVVFCILEDMAENIFLTISLRASFEDVTIIALSNNKESAHKLSMAGANKVIPIVQTTARMISDILEKPIVTEVMHSILYEKSELKVAQIQVEMAGKFEGKFPSDIKWNSEYGVIVLSIMHEDMSSEFIYSAKARHHAIKNGDIFIVVGYENDIKEFEKKIGSRCE